MTDFITALHEQVLLADGAMGSYLFELTGRLSETNHVYESLNVDQPSLIRRVHGDYLAAGARCLKTNTFSANRQQLRQFGLESKVAVLNRSGVELARAAAQDVADEAVFVLGSVGPTSPVVTDPAAIDEAYREQIEALIAAGADALILETFASQPQLEAVIDLIQSLPGRLPIIAAMTVGSSSGGAAEPAAPAFLKRMADKGVTAAGVNCCAPWDAGAFVEAAGQSPLPLAVMPNAGGFQRIGNRFMTSVNPEFAGRMARHLLDRGVRLIGGCCEMHPPHIREMHNYLRMRQPGAPVVTAPVAVRNPVGDDVKKTNGPFSRKLKEGRFAVSVEMLPPRGTDENLYERKIQFIAQLAQRGLADALDITDGSRGIPLMPPGDFIHLIRRRLAWSTDPIEMIPHFTGRDLNVMGVQSRLIGYHAGAVHNVLFITGDPPKMSPTYPRSTAVFDVDSVAMIRLTHQCLNAGVDFGGTPLSKGDDPRTHFTIGTGFEPESLDLERERRRLEEKLDSGADYVMTQPAFRHEPLKVLEPFRSRRPILVGVMILTGFEQAQRLTRVPGVIVPDATLERLGSATDPADQARIGIEIATEQVRWVVREGWPGLYLMSPGATSGILQVLENGLA